MADLPRTMLGFPAWPSVDPDPRRLSTGDDELDRKLVRWLDDRQGERDLRRDGETCVLVDRGVEIRASTGSDYIDSARKSLGIAWARDFFEAKYGRLPGPND